MGLLFKKLKYCSNVKAATLAAILVKMPEVFFA